MKKNKNTWDCNHRVSPQKFTELRTSEIRLILMKEFPWCTSLIASRNGCYHWRILVLATKCQRGSLNTSLDKINSDRGDTWRLLGRRWVVQCTEEEWRQDICIGIFLVGSEISLSHHLQSHSEVEIPPDFTHPLLFTRHFEKIRLLFVSFKRSWRPFANIRDWNSNSWTMIWFNEMFWV